MRRLTVSLNRELTADDSMYGVRVRCDERPDGGWDPCIEFESRRGIRMQLCPRLILETAEAVRAWAERLDESYLQEALALASKGPIRRLRKPTRGE